MDSTGFKKPFNVNTIAEDIDDGIKEVLKPRKEIPGDKLVQERHSTHGDFGENARISQRLKEWCRESPGWNRLTDVERESMDMIILKFSRILSGKSLEKQHWEDVVGYGNLALKQCS